MKKQVYNLQFPSWCPEMTIFGYRFTRVEDYKERLASLQHLGGFSAEFRIPANTGKHAITAYVSLPGSQEQPILEWTAQESTTALNDVLLLLSIFTKRDVFAVDETFVEGYDGGVLLADPRTYLWGGILRCSIPFKKKGTDPEWGPGYDVGFEEGINEVYLLIRNEDWQHRYGKGYFLFLARQAFKCHGLESAFVQCWTMWEHLFYLHNRRWLSHREMKRLASIEKLAFLLVEYGLLEQVKSHKKLEPLSRIRNRLVHNGRFPDQDSLAVAELFIRLTEFVLAKILGLSPSNVLNTQERWDQFMQTGGKGLTDPWARLHA